MLPLGTPPTLSSQDCCENDLVMWPVQAQLNGSLQAEVGRLQAELQAAHGLLASQAEAAAREATRTQGLTTALQAAEERVRECELVRRKLHNTILVPLLSCIIDGAKQPCLAQRLVHTK